MAVLTPVLLIIVIFPMGGGHGYFEPLFFVFPFAAIMFLWFDEINLLFVLISLLQFTAYGFIIDKLPLRRTTVVVGIMVIHVMLALITYQLRPEHF